MQKNLQNLFIFRVVLNITDLEFKKKNIPKNYVKS